jgi:hypothetical protein
MTMSKTSGSKVLNWVARIWTLASVAFVLIFLFGEGLQSHGVRPTAAEWVGLALWPGGVGLGLIVAWFRARRGGLIATSSLIAFYVWNLLERGAVPRGPFFILVAAPGLLFLLSSYLSRPPQAETV